MFEREQKEEEIEIIDDGRYLRMKRDYRRTKCSPAFERAKVAHALKRMAPTILMLLFSAIPGIGVANANVIAIEIIWQAILDFITRA